MVVLILPIDRTPPLSLLFFVVRATSRGHRDKLPLVPPTSDPLSFPFKEPPRDSLLESGSRTACAHRFRSPSLPSDGKR